MGTHPLRHSDTRYLVIYWIPITLACTLVDSDDTHILGACARPDRQPGGSALTTRVAQPANPIDANHTPALTHLSLASVGHMASELVKRHARSSSSNCAAIGSQKNRSDTENCQNQVTRLYLTPRIGLTQSQSVKKEDKLTKKTQPSSFNERVEKNLEVQARELWMPVSQEVDRSGPDAAKVYLDIEGQRLQDRVRNLINQITGS